jgi:guanine deaminase
MRRVRLARRFSLRAAGCGRRNTARSIAAMVNQYMQRAIALSVENVRSGSGGPFAAVIVQGAEIIGEGSNRVTSMNDPTAHPEVLAIREACAKLRAFQLAGCDIYCTCEPCPMCLGAIYWARLARVFFANTAADAAALGFSDAFIYAELSRPPSRRSIPLIALMRDQAAAAFRAWEQKPDKIVY